MQNSQDIYYLAIFRKEYFKYECRMLQLHQSTLFILHCQALYLEVDVTQSMLLIEKIMIYKNILLPLREWHPDERNGGNVGYTIMTTRLATSLPTCQCYHNQPTLLTCHHVTVSYFPNSKKCWKGRKCWLKTSFQTALSMGHSKRRLPIIFPAVARALRPCMCVRGVH